MAACCMGSISPRTGNGMAPWSAQALSANEDYSYQLVTLAESKMLASFGTWVPSTRHKPETSAFCYLKNWWPEGIPLHYGQLSLTPDLSRNFNQAPNSGRVEFAARQLSRTLQIFWQCYSSPGTLAASRALVTACKRPQRKLSVQNKHSWGVAGQALCQSLGMRLLWEAHL